MSNARREAADAIHSASIHLLRRVGRDDAASGISPARLSALSVLVFAGPRTLTELAAAEKVRVPTMSRLVAALEEEGLVRRRPHPDDARAAVLHATAKGRRVLDHGRELRLSLLEHLLDHALDREVETIRKAAAIIERVVEASEH